jgi:hypothetical protein
LNKQKLGAAWLTWIACPVPTGEMSSPKNRRVVIAALGYAICIF